MRKGLNIIVVVFLLSLALGGGSLVSGAVVTRGLLGADSGMDISDYVLSTVFFGGYMILEGDIHSALIVFTQNYGGEFLDDFSTRTKTTVLSATSAGERAYYGGYHAGAVQALAPGTDSDTIHAAGVAAAHANETPSSQGSNVSIPALPGGGIAQRYVVCFAPGANRLDKNDCETIRDNFAGDANTTVLIAMAGGVKDGYEYSGGLNGLTGALMDVDVAVAGGGAVEQVILYVTGEGGMQVCDDDVTCADGTCNSTSLDIPNDGDMANDSHNVPNVTVSVMAPGPSDQTVDISLSGGQSFSDVPLGLGDAEGGFMWMATLDEGLTNLGGEIVTTDNDDVTFDAIEICLESGDLTKVVEGVCTYYSAKYDCCLDTAAAGLNVDMGACFPIGDETACNAAGCKWNVVQSRCTIDMCMGNLHPFVSPIDNDMDGLDALRFKWDFGRQDCDCAP